MKLGGVSAPSGERARLGTAWWQGAGCRGEGRGLGAGVRAEHWVQRVRVQGVRAGHWVQG